MKVFLFLVVLFFASCSTKKEEKTVKKQENSTFSYFEMIFDHFSSFELGKEGKTLTKSDFLTNDDHYSYTVEAENDKIIAIVLAIYVQKSEKAQKLLQNIVKMYNEKFGYTKKSSNFTTWSYTTEENLPVQVILIYEKELNRVNLKIGYKAQR